MRVRMRSARGNTRMRSAQERTQEERAMNTLMRSARNHAAPTAASLTHAAQVTSVHPSCTPRCAA
jgi:hypothetical protein